MRFYWTFGTLGFSIVVLIFAVICCFISWRRAGRTKAMAALEVLRMVLILAALFTLNKPQIPKENEPEEKPKLIVLHDVSDSMLTKDVESDADDSSRAISRTDAAQPILKEERWLPVKQKMNVEFQEFSSTLRNPTKGTNLDEALQDVMRKNPNLRGIVLISDGDWNIGGSPGGTATELRMKEIKVWPVAMGSETRLPDVELKSTQAPDSTVVNKILRVPFRVVNWLPTDRTFTVTLTGTRGAPVEKNVTVPAMGRLQDTIEWTPDSVGKYDLKLSIPVADQEAIDSNNEVSLGVQVKQEALRVLIVESYPRWEYRYLRNALERDPGVTVECLLFHPDTDSVGGGRGYLEEFPAEKDLFNYDVVFLGDVGTGRNQLTLENCQHLRQLVRSQAGGLVFLPGFRGRQLTLLAPDVKPKNVTELFPLSDLYPVKMDVARPRGIGSARPARFALTETGRRSLLTRLEPEDGENEAVWNSLPGFQWYAAAINVKEGREMLVVHANEANSKSRIPLIATGTSGTGKLLYMGTDGAWRWRKGVEDLYHYRFWGQVVRWMGYQRHRTDGKFMRLFPSPDRPEEGNEVTLNANVMSPDGEPLRDGTVVVEAESPGGQIESIRLAAAAGDYWGLFTGTFTPREGGVYRMVTTCTETGARLESELEIRGTEREKVGLPARHAVLKEIARTTGGEMADADAIDELVQTIVDLPEREPDVLEHPLWSDPIWGALIIVLLAVFWTGRKFAGLA